MNVHVQLLIVFHWPKSSCLLGGRVKEQDAKDGRRSVNPKYSRHSMVFVTPIGHIFIHSHNKNTPKMLIETSRIELIIVVPTEFSIFELIFNTSLGCSCSPFSACPVPDFVGHLVTPNTFGLSV